MKEKGLPVVNPHPVSPDARQFLRQATHDDHVRLNLHPLLSGITRPGYALSSYQLVLVAYYHYYRELEAAIDRALAAGVSTFAYEARRKLGWLASDLAYFGIDPEAVAWRPASPVAAFSFADEGALLGALYTVEGSSLGGQVIIRHLAAQLGLGPATGGRFFYGYGEETMSLWTQFEAFMNQALIDDTSRGSAQHAARTTFATMERILDAYLARHQSAIRP